jgi:hypothetical protein
MSSTRGKHPGVSLGEGSTKESRRFGHAIHKAGAHTDADYGAADRDAEKVKRTAHKAPLTLPKKGGA